MLKHNFNSVSRDHYETPYCAYQDIELVLNKICEILNTTPLKLKLYDPYFCNGRVVELFTKLGFPNMHNQNEDFYTHGKDVNHDVLITNPPYSDDHMEKCLNFAKEHSRNFLICFPNYVYRSKYFDEYFSNCYGRSKPFFLAPINRYVYKRPRACETSAFIEKEHRDYIKEDGLHSPFLATWLVYCGSETERIFNEIDKVKNKNYIVAKTHKGCKWKLKKMRNGGKYKNKKRKRRNKMVRPNNGSDSGNNSSNDNGGGRGSSSTIKKKHKSNPSDVRISSTIMNKKSATSSSDYSQQFQMKRYNPLNDDSYNLEIYNTSKTTAEVVRNDSKHDKKKKKKKKKKKSTHQKDD